METDSSPSKLTNNYYHLKRWLGKRIQDRDIIHRNDFWGTDDERPKRQPNENHSYHKARNSRDRPMSKKKKEKRKRKKKRSARLLFHGIEEIDLLFDLLSIYSLTLFGIGFWIAVRDIRSEASNRRWETVSGKSKGEGSKVGRTMMDEESFREEAVGSCGEDY